MWDNGHSICILSEVQQIEQIMWNNRTNHLACIKMVKRNKKALSLRMIWHCPTPHQITSFFYTSTCNSIITASTASTKVLQDGAVVSHVSVVTVLLVQCHMTSYDNSTLWHSWDAIVLGVVTLLMEMKDWMYILNNNYIYMVTRHELCVMFQINERKWWPQILIIMVTNFCNKITNKIL